MRILTRHDGLAAVPKQGRANLQTHPKILKPGREGVAEVVEMEVLDFGFVTGLVPLMAEGGSRQVGEKGPSIAADLGKVVNCAERSP